ncbi:NADAR family protein [Streptomyces sp. NBC_00728]|uniref:NADAR family protein n=1 Tax=Streptomyces sp. NBC_00728 TaxID=2903676 RepID=UPI00386F9CF2
MPAQHPTYRYVDDERIPGITRHAFIRNGSDYHLTDLIVYADGLIDCWGLVGLVEFEEKLRSGWVATTLEEGARASVHHVAAWKFDEPQSWVTPEMLLGEVRDAIDTLNDRPDSTDRCLAAVDVYLADRTEESRSRLLDAYLAIPEHLRHYALGDMDYKDWPLQVLAVGVGGRVSRGNATVTEEMHAAALTYFAEYKEADTESKAGREAFGPVEPLAPAVRLQHVVFPKGWPDDPGLLALRNEYPCPIQVRGVEYPNVERAYLALSTDDENGQRAVLAAESDFAAKRAAEKAPRRRGWEQARLAVMAQLMRAKYAQHPALAELLLSTRDGKILYSGADSYYWGEAGQRGRNWIGRLLEVIRGELAAEAVGIGPAWTA